MRFAPLHSGRPRFSIVAATLALLAPVALQAQSAGDYRSAATGTWSAAATWEVFDGASWGTASIAPTSADGVITVRAGHTVTVTTVVTVDQALVEASAMLQVEPWHPIWRRQRAGQRPQRGRHALERGLSHAGRRGHDRLRLGLRVPAPLHGVRGHDPHRHLGGGFSLHRRRLYVQHDAPIRDSRRTSGTSTGTVPARPATSISAAG